MRFRIPDDVDITAANIYDGIYELKGGSLVRHTLLITKKLAFLTTFEDVGTGNRTKLYVFDIAHRSLIRDSAFKNSYLNSSAGIFIIDSISNRIFSVDKSGYYEKRGSFIIPAGLYSVQGRFFKIIKIVYKVGEEIPGDTSSLVPFFKSSISTGSKRALVLPGDWWKNEDQEYDHSGDSVLIARIVDKLFDLPEVRLSNSYVDSFTHHTHGIAARVMQRPGKSAKYYWIAVGYDSDLRFETYYNFYVWPAKMTIKYMDTFTGKMLTLAAWRKTRKPGDVIK